MNLKTSDACIQFHAFSQRGSGKPHNEDALLLNGHVFQGSVREQGEFKHAAKPVYFAVADGVSSSRHPRTASRRLLELLQSRLDAGDAATPIRPLLHQVQQDFVRLGSDALLHGMAATLVGVRLLGNAVTIFNVGDARLCADPQCQRPPRPAAEP